MPLSGSRYKLNEPTVVADIIDGEAIVMNVARGHYYSLLGTGADVWRMLVGGMTTNDIAAAASGRFGIALADVQPKIEALAERLVAENLVVVAEGTEANGHAVATFSAKSYEPPELTVYSDMKDLLALDPPLPDYEPKLTA